MRETKSQDLKPLRDVAAELGEEPERMRRWIKREGMRAIKNDRNRWQLNLEEARKDRDRIIWPRRWTTKLGKKLRKDVESTVRNTVSFAAAGTAALLVSTPIGLLGMALGQPLTEVLSEAYDLWEMSETQAEVGGALAFVSMFWVACIVASGYGAARHAGRMWRWNRDLEHRLYDADLRLRKLEARGSGKNTEGTNVEEERLSSPGTKTRA